MKLPEDIAPLAQWRRKNFKEEQNPKISKSSLKMTNSLGGDPSKGVIYDWEGVWGISIGGKALGEVEGAEEGVHGGLRRRF